MSKVILVIEKPRSCSRCPLFNDYYSDMCCKGLHNRTINYPYPNDFVQEWCPLKELPGKKYTTSEDRYLIGHACGWDDCIDEILGE